MVGPFRTSPSLSPTKSFGNSGSQPTGPSKSHIYAKYLTTLMSGGWENGKEGRRESGKKVLHRGRIQSSQRALNTNGCHYPLSFGCRNNCLSTSALPLALVHCGPLFARTFIRQTKAQTSRCRKKPRTRLKQRKINLTQFTKTFISIFLACFVSCWQKERNENELSAKQGKL